MRECYQDENYLYQEKKYSTKQKLLIGLCFGVAFLLIMTFLVWAFKPETYEEEVFIPLLRSMESADEDDYFVAGLEISDYFYIDVDTAKRVDVPRRYYICEDQEAMRANIDTFGYTRYFPDGKSQRIENDKCYFYLMKNGEPVRLESHEYIDYAVLFTLQGIHDEPPRFNTLHFDCLGEYFYEVSEEEFQQRIGLHGDFTDSPY